MEQSGQQKIVLLETSQSRRDHLRSVISDWGCVPFIFGTESSCFDNLPQLDPDLVITGPLPSDRTFRFINSLKMIKHNLPVLILSGDLDIQDFINNNGFDDVTVIKDKIAPVELKTAVRRILENDNLDTECHECPLLIGRSPSMIKIKKLIRKLNHSKESILISGESGTGKELVARAIHSRSERRLNPFVKVNAVELPYRLLEGELFGYDPDTFADLNRNKNGMFSDADKGTLFFEEIGALPTFLQVKLLQVIEDGGYVKNNTEKKEKVDVRIIASTTDDLDSLVENGKFRKDLYFRLNVFKICIPPLRHRIGDILPLCDFFTDKYCIEFEKTHYKLSEQIKAAFCGYHWPGNVSELERLVKSAVLKGDEESILENVSIKIIDYKTANNHGDLEEVIELEDINKYLEGRDNLSLKEVCSEFMIKTEKALMKRALGRTNWNRKKAAVLLDISYKSLLNKIKSYELA
jgi:DNA-binding NtrC family response regulator